MKNQPQKGLTATDHTHAIIAIDINFGPKDPPTKDKTNTHRFNPPVGAASSAKE